MKSSELVRIFPALKDKRINLTIGGSIQEVVLVKLLDERTKERSEGAVRVIDSGGLEIWAGSINKIEFIP
jgi:hypothetical protein